MAGVDVVMRVSGVKVEYSVYLKNERLLDSKYRRALESWKLLQVSRAHELCREASRIV